MKDFFSKLLTGISIGVVVALIPNALLGEILKLLIRITDITESFGYHSDGDEHAACYDWSNGRGCV